MINYYLQYTSFIQEIMQPVLIYWFIMYSTPETKQMFFKWLSAQACPVINLNKEITNV